MRKAGPLHGFRVDTRHARPSRPGRNRRPGNPAEYVGQRRVLVRAQDAVRDELTALPGQSPLLETTEHRRDVRRLFGERANRVERLSGRHQRKAAGGLASARERDGVATYLEADVANLDDELARGQAVEPKLAGRICANVAIDRNRPGVGARTRASCHSGSRRCREDARWSHDSANRERGCRRAARPRRLSISRDERDQKRRTCESCSRHHLRPLLHGASRVYATAIHSISTRAFSASPDAAIALRAGLRTRKYVR